MKKASIIISFDDEKLAALEFALGKENSSVQERMSETLAKLYEKTVPAPLREFLDSRQAPASQSKRSRPQPITKPKSDAKETAPQQQE